MSKPEIKEMIKAYQEQTVSLIAAISNNEKLSAEAKLKAIRAQIAALDEIESEDC